MKQELRHYTDLLIERYPILKDCEEAVVGAYDILEECFASGHKLLVAGNGGSAADADHIVGELMKGFKLPRKCSQEFAEKLALIDAVRGKELADRLQDGLPTIALTNHQGLNTAFINDVPSGGEYIFAQQIYGYGKPGDVFLGISTSGNSKNVMNAAVVAKALGLKIIGLTGQKGGELASIADIAIKAPSCETFMIQELHLPIYHCLCLMLEEKFFKRP